MCQLHLWDWWEDGLWSLLPQVCQEESSPDCKKGTQWKQNEASQWMDCGRSHHRFVRKNLCLINNAELLCIHMEQERHTAAHHVDNIHYEHLHQCQRCCCRHNCSWSISGPGAELWYHTERLSDSAAGVCAHHHIRTPICKGQIKALGSSVYIELNLILKLSISSARSYCLL